MSVRHWLSLGSLFVTLAVIAGALGSHLLKHVIPAELLPVYEKAVLYQSISAFGILFASLSAHVRLVSGRSMQIVNTFFLLGVLFFSGVLYLYTTTADTFYTSLAPFGGTCMIFGWTFLSIVLFRGPSNTL